MGVINKYNNYVMEVIMMCISQLKVIHNFYTHYATFARTIRTTPSTT